jgi:acyl transferase domain-containing protein
VAVIGMGRVYPGAHTLKQLWENILARRRQFRTMPDQRLPSADYFDPDPQTPDKTYLNRASVIDGFEFDWATHRIPKSTVEATDIVHWLALDTALKALHDAGYDRKTISKDSSGVVLGNTLTGEQTRSLSMRLRWPYVRKSLEAAAQARGLSAAVTAALSETMEE